MRVGQVIDCSFDYLKIKFRRIKAQVYWLVVENRGRDGRPRW